MNHIVIQRRDSARHNPARAAFAADVQAGLAGAMKSLPAKYFYDRRGSELFERICELPEYYPTRTELGLLQRHAPEMAALIGADAELVEFGAGALQKIRLLLDALQRPRSFLPIDISGAHLSDAAAALARDYPGLQVRPVAGDFTAPDLALPQRHAQARGRAGFFPGSTIGNFTPEEALCFLRQAARILGEDDAAGSGLLIGVDLVKDPALLHAAYNDAAGVTAAFNRNLLQRINRELNGDFVLDQFAHYAFYQPPQQRIEMHLVSLTAQSVQVDGRRYDFAAGESIHTENSYKYTLSGFRRLAEQAGFRPAAAWTDEDGLFSLHWLALG
ncbi:L-histidine N(alpha)-methyltransferase [Ferrovibrio sp.]|uniref:L-histidine N(alpha)-methyltransferase n=1 Tax=Ferrovibrio sp. TaxID=1917215 RepID=UPI002631A691|nr:L-histidine N(alpha)-methyltransferase [Ferrovibrio sp.]